MCSLFKPAGLPCGSPRESALTGETFAPETLVAALNHAGIRYVIVGGLAVGAHGVVRATRDIDLVPAPDASNIERLAEVLGGLDGQHPVQGQLTAENLAAPASIKLHTSCGEVHVLNRMPGTPAFDDLRQERLEVEIGPGIDAPVCSLAHLRAMKRASDRPRDRVDLAELDELHGPQET